MTSPTQPEVSAERREQIAKLLMSSGGWVGTGFGFRRAEDFWSFIFALDAQAKAEADARVEAMRDALKVANRIFQFDLWPMIEFGPHFNQAVKDAADATQAALALPIEGDGR